MRALQVALLLLLQLTVVGATNATNGTGPNVSAGDGSSTSEDKGTNTSAGNASEDLAGNGSSTSEGNGTATAAGDGTNTSLSAEEPTTTTTTTTTTTGGPAPGCDGDHLACPNGTIIYRGGTACKFPRCESDDLDCRSKCITALGNPLLGCVQCESDKACCKEPKSAAEASENSPRCAKVQMGYIPSDAFKCVPLVEEEEREEVAPAPVKNPGVNCLVACSGSGFCPGFCGYGNACCHLGDSTKQECAAALFGDFNKARHAQNSEFHECVQPKWDTADFWQVSDDAACKGSETEYEQCEGLEPCSKCKPSDCVFSDWSDWVANGDGTGLKYRSRNVAQFNNECGTCDGVLKETAALPVSVPILEPCEFNDWTDWTACDEQGQISRNRTFTDVPPQVQKALGCTGNISEIFPCNTSGPQDCLLGDWGAWTSCSATCEGGRQTRFRPILKGAEEGGLPCKNTTIEQKMCNLVPCKTATNCSFGDWLEWQVYEVDGKDSTSKVRSREMAAKAYWWTGKGCSGVVEEVNGSGDIDKPCPVEEWTDWGGCSASCGRGQKFRTRGSCLSKGLPEMETLECGLENPCDTTQSDCVLSDWREWTTCDSECGYGQHNRTREVIKARTGGGKGCFASLVELAPCKARECVKRDCSWNAWAEWSACTTTCGGGTRTRDRNVTAPRHGGKLCPPEDFSEIQACGTASCREPCQDATWSDWSDWGACSATCGQSSYRCHHRHVAVEANWCGKTLLGDTDECEVCTGLPTCTVDKDCVLSDWLEWSDCSCSCYGTTQRSRRIASMSTGNGQACSGVTSQVVSCNPYPGQWRSPPAACDKGVPDLPTCIIGDWTVWSPCSASCNGGIQIKNRLIINEPCNPSQQGTKNLTLELIEGCNEQACTPEDVTDCRVSAWGDWAQCNSCDAHTFRSRSFVSDATTSGKKCSGISMREVATCTGGCKYYGCKWSNYLQAAPCSATCGNGTKTVTRKLTAVQLSGRMPSVVPEGFASVAQDASACYGEEVALQACSAPACPASCVPLDCTFSDWSDWALYGGCGYEEKHRHRHTMNECGKPCVGKLSVTRVNSRATCSPTAPVNCVLSDWTLWTRCESHVDQRSRSRGVETPAKFGGAACVGSLKETTGCGRSQEEDSPCKVSTWSDWGVCKQVCENPKKDGHDDTGCPTGVQERSRTILSYAVGLGDACTQTLDEVKTCDLKGPSCTPRKEEHCVLEPAWSKLGTCIDGIAFHHRTTSLVAGGGTCSCSGSLTEERTCEEPPTDCQMSEWQNTTCQSNGHMYMHRQVHAEPTKGGALCPTELGLVADCRQYTPVDCVLGDWSLWSTCSATCGKGQETRSRVVVHPASLNGIPCEGSTEETQACELKKCGNDIDCEWFDWEDWHACTCTCGGGVKERSRHVKAFPVGQGAVCDVNAMKEAAPCNTQSCETCINGTFSDWSAWGACSASCIGGVKLRHRSVARPPNSCGMPPEGLLVDYESCSNGISCAGNVDCKFGDWSQWSACNKRCTGTQTRTRVISTQGYGTGAYCAGALEEAAPCNPVANGTIPEGCPVPSKDVACVLPDWGVWGSCSASCGVGQRFRERSLPTEPTDGFSTACAGQLYETGDCGNAACPSNQDEPVDCQWTAWGDWSACSAPGGQRHRHRDINQTNKNGGKPCVGLGETLDAMQTDGKTCYTRDLSTDLAYCGWGIWSPWTDCDATCGSAHRSRSRKLGFTSAKPLSIRLTEIHDELASKLAQGQSVETTHLAAAFVGGAMTLVLLSGLLRFSRGGTYGPVPTGPNGPYEQVPSHVEEAVGRRTNVETLLGP